jgi:putative PIN family toxin of toxin-antitoxin system
VTVPRAHVRAVVDTNVLVSGLISAVGPPARIIDAFRRDRFELVVSPAVLDELLDVLLRPYVGVTVR